MELRANQRNRYLALWEHANGISRVESSPPNLGLARSNICNFQCVYCWDHRRGNNVPRVKLEGGAWATLEALIPRGDLLSFHGISEFMVDPEFFDILGKCAAAGASLSLNTNGSVCTERHLRALADYPGKIVITFSLDAATPESFLKIRGANFDRVLRNIEAYVDRFSTRRARTWITVSFVIMRSNVHEAPAFVALAKKLKVDAVRYYRLHEYEALDWVIPTEDSGTFNYREERVARFPVEYNEAILKSLEAADALGVRIEAPAVFDAREIQELLRGSK